MLPRVAKGWTEKQANLWKYLPSKCGGLLDRRRKKARVCASLCAA